MNAFYAHQEIINLYKQYLQSFLYIKDGRMRQRVLKAFEQNDLIPEPLIQFNPSYERSKSLDNLIDEKLVNAGLKKIFGSFRLYRHQVEALELGAKGQGFIVTSGTGSGKSLTYLATVFNSILNQGEAKKKGVKAILVYPMNALINSQEGEIEKYAANWLSQFVSEERLKELEKREGKLYKLLEEETGKRFPITFRKYTGQEGTEDREEIKAEEPDIILTNYMMLELVMTRHGDEWLRKSMADNLAFLVFDELHTYRGRQGSDVAMLIRRIQRMVKQRLTFIGTSATMSTQGDRESRKQAVADVAHTIFGQEFRTNQIIGEYLETCTQYTGSLPSKEELKDAIQQGIDKNHSAEQFVKHPLAIWLENRIALVYPEGSSPERAKPCTLSSIIQALAEDSDLSEDVCQETVLALLDWTEALNLKGAQEKPRRSFLPYKFHQFISQAGTLFVTLQDRDKREIRLKTERYLVENGEHRLLYPILFSRHSGHDFICVSLDFENELILPRDPDELPNRITKDDVKGNRKTGRPKRVLKEEDFNGGYLIMPIEGEEPIWSDSDVQYLPDTWLDKNGDPTNFYQFRIPRKIFFNETGHFSFDAKYDLWAWYMPAKLLFDPTAGMIYDLRTKEITKLMRLGNEGRSTATTLLSFSVIKALHGQKEASRNQKLLSFTDNRQDASLQSGHFNDFIATGHLRSAIYHALNNHPSSELDIGNIAEVVFDTLGLNEEEYAKSPNPDWPDEENARALKVYLTLRIIYDLRRGWRYNLPNLEQCALLQINYKKLLAYCEVEKFWSGLDLFGDMTPEERAHICMQVLDYFRTSYAIDHRYLLEQRSEIENRLKDKLNSDRPWSLDLDERIEIPYIMVPRSIGRTPRRVYTASLGSRSYLGKYFKRLFGEREMDWLSEADFSDFIERVCETLKKGNFLSSEEVRGKKGATTGYRLRLDHVVWQLGDGKSIRPDEVRVSSYKTTRLEPNAFFKDFYRQDFKSFGKTLLGREHTGQLVHEQRITREEQFRAGEISSLFCSPTMELGIDIADLNIVHMRNVPPTPANYAQRSGRAGRSGQAALVFTYCSTFSPHDRNYFDNAEQMVAGVVVPPQIDLANEELILSHMNAYFLMELGLQQLNLRVPEILDLKEPGFPINKDVANLIKNQLEEYKEEWSRNFLEAIKSILPRLKQSYWFQEAWVYGKAGTFLKRFDESFDRWRQLYKAANTLVERSRMVMDDPTVKRTSDRFGDYYNAKREHNIGLKQRELLFNDSKSSFGSQSEFYIFRYLASEGFLPGYNFTRLPIRTFVGYKHQDKGAYISRPRFIALREFGPHNLIYHNGNKYQINRMMLLDADVKTEKLKVSKATGYAFMNEEIAGANNDPITETELKGGGNTEVFNHLLSLNESEAQPRERISCEEEERLSTGFELHQYFSYPKGMDSTLRSTIRANKQELLHLIYGPATRLIQHSRGWTRSTDRGFLIDRVSGRWMYRKEMEEPEQKEKAIDVELYTSDTSETLYIQPVKDLELDPDGVITLAYALKRGIESLFQVEENEVGIWVMGRQEEPNIMLYESAEGSLGILSQLVENSNLLKELFRTSYRILHFDPETREDLGEGTKPKASYEDLLSYYNQRYHSQLDRHKVRRALELLMDSEVDNQEGERSLEEQYQYLKNNYDLKSSTEKPFIDYLYQNGIRLPHRAQVNLPDYYVSADFVYKNGSSFTLVFCDGSVHDDPKVKAQDEHKRGLLRDAGYDVIEWHYKEPIEELVRRRKDIFRKIR